MFTQYSISLNNVDLVSVNENILAYIAYKEAVKLLGEKNIQLKNNMKNLRFEKDEYVKLLKHSVHPEGYELITFLLKIPKFLMAQLNTHRNLVRNTASSRAIPCEKYRKMVNDDTVNMEWGMAKKGMSSDENVPEEIRLQASLLYEEAKRNMLDSHIKLEKLGIHKEFTNRLLEPFAYTYTIVTGTEWLDFIKLRKTQEAQKQMREIAEQISWLKDNSVEKNYVNYGEWHIPMVDESDNLSIADSMIMGIARCAWISYNNHQKEATIEDAESMVESLINNKHLSPLEHCQVCVKTYSDCKEDLSKFTNNAKNYLKNNFAYYNNMIVHTRQYKGFYSYRSIVEDHE